MRSHLLHGKVMHRRAEPAYRLEHDVFYLAIDLDELDRLELPGWLLGRGRRAVLEVRDTDHWPEPAADLRATVHAHLRALGEDPTGWRITLVTNPRFLGFVFNPASFYLCRDASGELAIVIVEVHNTHLERHLYTLRPRPGAGRFVAAMDKDFYVSPFIDMRGRYTVHVQDAADRLRIAINERRDDRPVLATSLVLTRSPLHTRTVLRTVLRHPLMTQRTMALIHWHALHLWRRGVPFRRHRDAVGRGADAVTAGSMEVGR